MGCKDMKKQIQGIFINEETGDEILNPYIQVYSNERSYLKATRSTLSRIIYDLSGNNLTVKMLAIIIDDIKETDNHICFGENRLIEFFSDYKEESVINAFNRLKNMNFFKEISKCELIFNPDFISFKNSENYNKVLNEYLYVEYRNSKQTGNRIKSIGDITPIPRFDNTIHGRLNFDKTAIFDYHFAKVKEVFIDSLGELPMKKMKVLSLILDAIKENDKNIIVSQLKIPANKETISSVVKYLREKKIFINAVHGVYHINAEYISASTPYKRKTQFEKIDRLKMPT